MQDDAIIKIENVTKLFKLPHEKSTSIKSLALNFYKRKKSYEMQKALQGISFDIKKGEFFGVVGRNGSGKSTLLKILAGVYAPSEGHIQVNGKLTPFIELGVGFNPELTGRENVFLNGALLGFSQKEMEALYAEIVEFAELEKFMDQKLKNYSSGMQVRLAFSIAIRAKSDILLIDEVLAVGDSAFQRKCYNFFDELKKNRVTVILVSHDMNAVKRFCTRAALINQGNLDLVGSPDQIAELYEEQNASEATLFDKEANTTKAGAEIIELSVQESKKKGFGLKDTITLKFLIKADESIKVAPGINITRADGQVVSGLTCHAQVEPRAIDSGKTAKFTISFAARQFTKGTYMVDGSVYNDTSPSPVFYRSAMTSFKILEDEHSWGVFNLDCKWERSK